MPAPEAATLDVTTLRSAVRWALEYLLDPKRGAGKNLPSDEDLKKKFPSVTQETVKIWLFNEIGTTDFEQILKDQKRLQDELAQLKKDETTQKVSQVRAEVLKTPPPPRRVSALGVLEELKLVEPLLAKHHAQATQELTKILTPQVETFVKNLKVENLAPEALNTLTVEISQEVIAESLENLAKIDDVAQIPIVIADSLTQTLVADPVLEPKLARQTEEKIFAKILPIAQAVTAQNAQTLENAAVIPKIAKIVEITKPNEQITQILSEQVAQAVETQAPLTTPKEQIVLKSQLALYLVNYSQSFQKLVAPILKTGKIPKLAELKKIQEQAHIESLGKVTIALAEDKASTAPFKIDTKILASEIGELVGLKPISQTTMEIHGLGGAQPKTISFARLGGLANFGPGIAMASPQRQIEASQTLLAYNQPKMENTIAKLVKSLKKYEGKKSVPRRAQKEYRLLKKQIAQLREAQNFPKKQPKRYKTMLTFFKNLPFSQRLDWSSSVVWNTREAFLGNYRGIFVQRHLMNNEIFLAGRNFGALSFGLGSARFTGFHFKMPSFGMGVKVTPQAMVGGAVASVVGDVAKRVLKITGGLFGGLAIYFLGLGQIGFLGFLVGAAIGGTVGLVSGAIIGAQIGAAIGTFVIPIPVVGTVVGAVVGGAIGGAIGFFAGASIGGLAGGLITNGIASGSVTATTTGTGIAVGATAGFLVGGPIGTVLGALIGAGAGFLIGKAAAALGIPAGVAGGATLGAAIGFWVGGPIGAAIGAGIGASIGWLTTGGLAQIGNVIVSIGQFVGNALGLTSSAAGATAAATSAVGTALTGLAAGLWGGLSSVAGGVFGALSSAAGFITGGLTSATIPTTLAVVAIPGAIGGITIGSILVGTIGATSFFTTDTDEITAPTGDNQYFTVTKTATPTHLDLPEVDPPGSDITFTIGFSAKVKISNISIDDQMKVDGENNHFIIDTTPFLANCPAIKPEYLPNESWNCDFIVHIVNNGHNFDNTLITNTFTVRATPEGNSEVIDKKQAFVSIGEPPNDCPTIWPLDHGRITQGPEGSTSHNNLLINGGEEAIDIGDNARGTTTYATFSGNVSFVNNDPDASGYGRFVDIGGFCNGVAFTARWAHLNSISAAVVQGQSISFRQVIGGIDDTGNSDGDHLHYSFFSLVMKTPNIPEVLSTRSCEDGSTPCGVDW